MAVSILALALLAAQPGTSLPGPDTDLVTQKEVAFETLTQGHSERAAAELEQRLLDEPEDPALLINLGAAYVQLGREERAAAAYQAAIDSRTRYHLELADGRWLDSRRAARIALQALGTRATVAAR